MGTKKKVPEARFPSLAKYKYVAGWQCLKRLYYLVREPDLAEETSDATQARFDQGHEVGAMARRAFPGGVLIDEEHTQHDAAVARTAALLKNAKVPAIFEAAFTFEGIRVRVDVLERQSRGRWRLIEVKQSTAPKDYHQHDVAIQKYVLEGCGIKVAASCIMHISSSYVYPGGEIDPHALFCIKEVTSEIATAEALVPSLLRDERKVLARRTPPDIAPGPQCYAPFECEFQSNCMSEIPDDHIAHLPRTRKNQHAAFEQIGIASIAEVPEHLLATDIQRRAWQSVRGNKAVYLKDDAGLLPSHTETVLFMDFETYMLAVPRHVGTRPYQKIPFQWAICVSEKRMKTIHHFEFLAEDGLDPRESFVRHLLEVLEAFPGRIVIYNLTFEEGVLKGLAEAFPKYATRVAAVRRRLWDLLPFVREHVYHPAFRGSFSIKNVLPALIPELTYDALDVSDGNQAGAVFFQTLEPACDPKERERLRKALFDYCRMDAWAMVKLLELLVKKTRPL